LLFVERPPPTRVFDVMRLSYRPLLAELAAEVTTPMMMMMMTMSYFDSSEDRWERNCLFKHLEHAREIAVQHGYTIIDVTG
jgi:hypothetical protein